MHLFLYTTAAVAIGGVEGAVVAVGASAGAFASIAVGAGEASVDGYFLHLAVENAAGVAAVIVVVESLFCTHFFYAVASGCCAVVGLFLIFGVKFVKKVCNDESILYICTVRGLYEWFAYVYNQL